MGTTALQKTFDRIGSTQHSAAQLLSQDAKWADNHLPLRNNIKSFLGMSPTTSFKRFTHPFVRASMSYTPYMIAKGETALLWDSGKMDMSAERMIDGAANLNWYEFKSGAGEVWNTFLHRPLADPVREAEGERRNLLDRAKPDIFAKTEAQIEAEERHAPAASWRERVITGAPAVQPVMEKKEEGYAHNVARKSSSHADQEEMKKVLRDVTPPTISVH
jgi:hypothetical protein